MTLSDRIAVIFDGKIMGIVDTETPHRRRDRPDDDRHPVDRAAPAGRQPLADCRLSTTLRPNPQSLIPEPQSRIPPHHREENQWPFHIR